MIRKLVEADREQCLDFVSQKAAENLFIIGDIEAFGFEEEFQEVWGDFTDDGQLRAVLLRYQDNYIPFAPGAYDAGGFTRIFEQDNRVNKMLSGINSVVKSMTEHLTQPPKNERELYYAKCDALKPVLNNERPEERPEVKKATVADVDRIQALHQMIDEFETNGDQNESTRRNMEKGMSRTFFIEVDGQMVSTAMTTAENSAAAMVIGVCTLSGYEKKGYATACMEALCRELLDEGRELCLFYDNPAAGNIYKRLGFYDIGHWVMNSYGLKPSHA